MKYIIGYLVKKFGISALVTAISVFYFGAVIAFYAFAINGILTLYKLIQSLLDMLGGFSTSSSSSVVSLFGSLLNVSGFLPALTDSMPLITSALVFMLSKLLWRITKDTYKDIVAQASRAANLYV